MIRAAILSGLALALAALPSTIPAQTGEVFQVPNGCTAFLTVQSRSCTVSHHWTCSGDPEGSHWRVSADSDGPFYLTFTDSEFRWLRSWELLTEVTGTLVEPEEDPASLTELFETGSDSMVYSIVYSGPRGQLRRDFTGFDRLTGEQVTVDGRILDVTEFAYQFDTGDGLRRTAGNQFVHRGWRLFFGGVETTTLSSGEVIEENNSPMEFAEPGEPGFLATQPIHDCGDMMSALDITPRPVADR